MKKPYEPAENKNDYNRRVFFRRLLLLPGIAWLGGIFLQLGCDSDSETDTPDSLPDSGGIDQTDTVDGGGSSDTGEPVDDTGGGDTETVEDITDEPDVEEAIDADDAEDIGEGDPDTETPPAADVNEPDIEDPIIKENCDPTLPDALGPFYEPGSPETSLLASEDEPGERIRIHGRVYGPECEVLLAGAVVDVWQADDAGDYHGVAEGSKLRGVMITDGEGRYSFESIKPGAYPLGGSFRPSHFHFRVSTPGYKEVVTQLYFEGDPYLSPNDPCGPPTCFSDDEERIIALESVGQDDGSVLLEGIFDIILAEL